MGFENGLSLDQVEFYYRQEFTAAKMEEARWGLQNGLK
jgi:hypothetical protein